MRVLAGTFSFGISLASTKFLTTVLGEQIHISSSLETGNVLFSPISGSRKIPEAKLDAPPEGAPGVTTTVGSLSIRPSSSPRRE
ncbi:hypothetical protein MMC08_006959 [Hypocenomyce scalaris]|nr:hypothetical protein [Hypocenomyce scalaris]